MPDENNDPMYKFTDLLTPPPDAEKRLEQLRALGPVRIPEAFRSPPQNLTDEQRYERNELIETSIRRGHIRRLLEMRRASLVN